MIGLSFINQHDSLYLKERLECLDDGMHMILVFAGRNVVSKNKMFIYGKLLIQAM